MASTDTGYIFLKVFILIFESLSSNLTQQSDRYVIHLFPIEHNSDISIA